MIVQCSGDPTAPTLVFLHGFMGSHVDWLPIASQFENTHYCVCVDLPGHGTNTSLDRSTDIDFTWIATDLVAALQAINVTTATFIGYSLGGRVALFTALQYPTMVTALILESASPGLETLRDRQNRVQVDQQRAAEIAADLPGFLTRWYTLPFFKTLDQTSTAVQAMLKRRAANDAQWLAKLIVALSPGYMPNLWQQLPALQCPLTFITGELDQKYTAIGQRILEQHPATTLSVIPAAGHNTHLEQPAAFTQALNTIV